LSRSAEERLIMGHRAMGRGLFIARPIVTAHGGEIRVRSAECFGTTFEVLLPIGRLMAE
jgi:signal transduction histidine kinase